MVYDKYANVEIVVRCLVFIELLARGVGGGPYATHRNGSVMLVSALLFFSIYCISVYVLGLREKQRAAECVVILIAYSGFDRSPP